MEAMQRSTSVRRHQNLEEMHADHITSNESEDSSILQRLIDQNGIEYVEINGTHVKAHAASHTEGRDSDEEDNEEVDNSALGSTRAPRGRGLRQSTRQTNIASSPNDEASSGHDEHYSTMKQDMSTDNLETHELTHVFIGEDEERSQAADTQTTAAGNLNSSQPSRPTKRGPNILDDTIPARTLQHNLDYGERKPDEDDDEHPDLLSVMKLGLERSRETAVVEDHTRQSQRKQRTSAQSYGGDQGQAQVQYANTHTMSNVGESSAYGSNGMNPYGPFIPTIPHGGKEANHPPSTSGPGSSPLQPTFKPAARRDVLPPDQRPSSRTRHTSRHADIEDLCYRGTDQPTARPTRDERSLSPQERQERRTRHDERMFERGRQQGRWEERNAARRFKDAQAECGATDEGEMDEEEG